MKNSFTPHLLLILANVIYGLDYPLYKIVTTKYMDPMAILTLALVVTAVIYLAQLPFRKLQPLSRHDVMIILLSAVFMGVLKKWMLIGGMKLTTPFDASIINTIGPIFVLIISAIFMHEKLRGMRIVGVVLGAVGTVMVVMHSGSVAVGSDIFMGNIMMLIGALSVAVYLVIIKSLLERVDSFTILFWIYNIAAVISIPMGGRQLLHTDWATIPMWIYVVLFFITIAPTYLGNVLMVFSLKKLSPTTVSIYGYVQPIVATAVAVYLGQNKIVSTDIYAAMLVVIGVYFVVKSYGDKPPKLAGKPQDVPKTDTIKA